MTPDKEKERRKYFAAERKFGYFKREENPFDLECMEPTPLILLTGLGLLLGLILSLAQSRLKVYEDPRIEKTDQLLPQANCGACGSPGCRAFAERLVQEGANPALCTVSPEEGIQAIASLLGIEAEAIDKRVARLACQGGSNVARQRARYRGHASCQAANLVAGGAKGCTWGCLGHGDCERICSFGAIKMDPHDLPQVDEAKCTACGDCVTACPKDLFSLEREGDNLFVACRNLLQDEDALAECRVACTGCGLCAADSPEGLVIIQDHLARVDRSQIEKAQETIIQRCPTGAILWIQEGKRHKGKAAVRIIRESELPLG